MKEPVDHILRPQLPWRSSPGITECGYNAERAPTISRAEYFDRVKNFGRQRTAMLTCMTCADTASRWSTWEDDPRQAMQREIAWEGRRSVRSDESGCRLKDELLAVAILIEAHRDEFDAYIAAAEQRREWLAKKAANVAGKKGEKPKAMPW